MPVLSNGPEVFAENFSKNSSIEDSGISLNAFPSRTYRKLHIYVTPMLVKKGHNRPWFVKAIWCWLYSTGGSEELWAWTFIHTSCWTLQYASEVILLYLRMLERGTKNYRPIRLLSSVSKISGMVSGLSVQLHIFWQLHLIELLGLLVARYPKLSKGFDARAFTIMKFKASRNSRLDIWPSVFSQ